MMGVFTVLTIMWVQEYVHMPSYQTIIESTIKYMTVQH